MSSQHAEDSSEARNTNEHPPTLYLDGVAYGGNSSTDIEMVLTDYHLRNNLFTGRPDSTPVAAPPTPSAYARASRFGLRVLKAILLPLYLLVLTYILCLMWVFVTTVDEYIVGTLDIDLHGFFFQVALPITLAYLMTVFYFRV